MTQSPLPDVSTPPMPIRPGNVSVGPGAVTGNPVLDEISTAHANLSPQAQQAIEGAHQIVGISTKHTDPALATSAASPEVAVPGVSGPRGPLPNLSPEFPVPSGPVAATGGRPMADVPSDLPIPSHANIPLPGMGSPSPSAPMPVSPLIQERSRLNAAPLPSSDPNAHTAMDTGRSGIEQIHNPWVRGLATAGDVIASGLFPRFGQFIPGTSAHHQLRVNENEGAIKAEEESAKSAADVAHTGAETQFQTAQAANEPTHGRLEGSQADEAEARAENIRNPQKALSPKDKYIPVGDGVFNAESGDWAKEPTDKKLSEVTEIDPEKGKALGLTPNKDGKYIVPNASLGELLKPPVEKTPNQYGDFKAGYIKDHPNATAEQIETAFTKAHATPHESPDHGVSMIDPASGKLLRIEPGQEVPQGAVTATQSGAQNAPTTQQRNVAAQAGLVHEQTPMMLSEIDRLKDKLGPVSGRWNEFMQGKVGTDDPDMAGLRADLLMYSSAVALMHARGRLPENLREEFDHAINAPKQTAENLTAVIKKIDQWAGKNINTGARGSGGAATDGGKVQEWTRDANGKLVPK